MMGCSTLTIAKRALIRIVKSGALTTALRTLNPKRKNGPWQEQCDNESFLRSAASKRAYVRRNISLWAVPPKSPDLNPIENFWSWIRRRLCTLVLQDLRAKRKVLGRTAHKARLARVLQSVKAQKVAASCTRKFRAVCKAVVARKGAASSN